MRENDSRQCSKMAYFSFLVVKNPIAKIIAVPVKMIIKSRIIFRLGLSK